MATLALNKLKSTLVTRNDFTGRAMDRMTKEKLSNLFNGDLNYLSWEHTYIERRFHPERYLTKIRNQRRAIFEREHIKHQSLMNSNLTEMLEIEEAHDTETQDRFKRFLTTHNGCKPLLALDVDHTMIYVRFFAEELAIGDICTYFGDYACMEKNNSKVVKIRLTLCLDIASNELIDRLGTERIDHLFWTSSNEEMKQYTKRSTFEYCDVACTIRKVMISGCILQILHGDTREEIEIDFTQSNDNLNRFEPMLERPGMLPVDFIYEGFLVRCRPNLDEFLEYCNDDFDVVIYTSANKLIYEGLLTQLNLYINESLGNNQAIPLWNDVLYRDDCVLRYKANGKPYHHKDLSLFGCDLSRVIMLDNSPIVCQGQEANLILIADFFGKDEGDDELMEAYVLLDAISCIQGDVRYFLCGLEDDLMQQTCDVSTEALCLNLTQQLVQVMKAYYSEEMNVDDVMTVDQQEDEMESGDIFAKSMSLSPLQVEAILDDLQHDVSDTIDATETADDRMIPPKHSKNESVVSVRDLRVIKQEKLEKKRKLSLKAIAFDENTNFVNSGKAMATPTRKRRTSSIMNSMAPKPSSKAILHSSYHGDFFVSFLQQLTHKEDAFTAAAKVTLEDKLEKLKRSEAEKGKTIEMYTNKEKRNVLETETMRKEIQMCKKIIQMTEENTRLTDKLQQINNRIDQMTTNKEDLQEEINHVIASKMQLIKNTNEEIDHYRRLLKQIAQKHVTLSYM